MLEAIFEYAYQFHMIYLKKEIEHLMGKKLF